MSNDNNTDIETVKTYHTHPRSPVVARAKMASSPDELAALSRLATAIRAYDAAEKDANDDFYAKDRSIHKTMEIAENDLRRAIHRND